MFDIVQTFYIDPNAVGNEKFVYLADVQLFFRQLPNANNNAAGNRAPGVTVHLCKTVANNIPDVNQLLADSNVRKEYIELNTSFDANTPTIFAFSTPIPVQSGKFYGVAIHFDSPEFVLWYNKQGDDLVGTNIISPGPSGKFQGAYYNLGTDGTITQKSDFELKFIVDGINFQANTVEIDVVPDNYEFIAYDGNSISNTFLGGELVYQDFGGYANGALSANVTFYGNGTINVASNTNLIQGVGTTFTNSVTGFSVTSDTNPSYIVITDGTAGNTGVFQITAVANDTVLYVNGTPTFTNAAAFYKKTAVAKFFDANYGNNTLILHESTSNVSTQFSNSSMKTITLTAGGTNFNNSDYIVVSGGGATINAAANITTNSTGGIVSINITNAGFGFTSTGTISIFAANGSASNGSGQTVVFVPGSTLRGELSQAYCNLNNFFDWRVDFFTPDILAKIPDTCVVNVFANFANTAHDVDPAREFSAEIGVIDHSTFDSYILSTATEVNTANSNLANVDGNYKSAYLKVDLGINSQNSNIFTSPYINQEKIDLISYQYNINNSDAGEVGDNGNCTSKHISIPFTFANGGLAQALRVYVNQHNPLGTNVEIYARLYNASDPDTFVQKSWTPLTITAGANVISSIADLEDFHQVTYELPFFPASNSTANGTVTVNSGNNQLVTSVDLSSNVAVNQLIKVYNPTAGFANQVYFVALVTAVNSTIITTNFSTTNTAILGSGFAVDVLNNKNTAFKDIQNANVATYYNSTMSVFTKFSTMAIKILFLSNTTYIVPKVEKFRAIGVAA